MNIYSTEFFARCPVNGIRIHYRLRIETTEVIHVEKIIERVDLMREGFHETFADDLFAAFGGRQTLVADHHGVQIETHRFDQPQYLDQRVGGMAGTPGY